ncbi:MAG: hypothetical protein KGH71_06135 [Candidatus Micrarchaeota archaeon]|nr:hypothetical protein [Candidatus Micrarchaeota archaeon]
MEIKNRVQWEERPYGRKHVVTQLDNESVAIIQIDPKKNTAIGADLKDLDKSGLRAHPGTLCETIKVLTGDAKSLKYTARDKNGTEISTKFFSPGEEFDSVAANEIGYWHNLENVSKTMLATLEVTTIKQILSKLDRE